MIGWRPYLLTGLALLLVVVAVLDVAGAGRKPSRDPCASAAMLAQARFFSQARDAYAAVLKSDPTSKCATGGLTTTTYDLCVQAQRIAQSDVAQAHRQLVVISETDPRPVSTSCVWKQLLIIGTASVKR
jgi:hypothetical protein